MPGKATNLREDSTKRTTTSIDVLWDEPATGEHPQYYIEWHIGNSKVDNATVTTNTKSITGLEPGQKYQVKVYTVSNDVKSVELSETFATGLCFLRLHSNHVIANIFVLFH